MGNNHYFCHSIILKLKSMTREEYFDVIGVMQQCCSILHISETRKRLDLADWVEQMYYLCILAEEANKIIDVDRRSMQMSIEHWYELSRLNSDLNEVTYDLYCVIPEMAEGMLPGDIIEKYDEEYDDEEWYESKEDDYNRTMDDFRDVKFIGDDEKAIIEEAGATVKNILTEYRNTLAKFSAIVERADEVLAKFCNGIRNVDSEIAAYLIDRYYFFLERKEVDVEERLVTRLYEKYVDRLDEPLEPRHWASMLKDYLTTNDGDAKKKVVKESFSYSHALDISDSRINHYLCKECRSAQKISEFFNYFLEVAILQSKTRSDIKIIRRPMTEGKVEPLPFEVVDKIRDNAELNRLFREALGRVAENVGAGKTWKWSHVQKVLEDDKFIMKLGQKGFGRLINNILPDIKEEHVRQSVKNNPISFTPQDRGRHYREISETNTLRSVFIGIGDEFEELRNAME